MSLPKKNLPPWHSSHYLIGLEHRIAILETLPDDGAMLEYGAGDSTEWFLANKKPTQTILTVENNPQWAQKVTGAHFAGGAAGANAKEAPTLGTIDYVWYPVLLDNPRLFDVVLVDGVWRTICLLAAWHMLKLGGSVFLHDSHRRWYDAGKAIYSAEIDHGACEERPQETMLELIK